MLQTENDFEENPPLLTPLESQPGISDLEYVVAAIDIKIEDINSIPESMPIIDKAYSLEPDYKLG